MYYSKQNINEKHTGLLIAIDYRVALPRTLYHAVIGIMFQIACMECLVTIKEQSVTDRHKERP